jgi:LPS sulfotransferase NodH
MFLVEFEDAIFFRAGVSSRRARPQFSSDFVREFLVLGGTLYVAGTRKPSLSQVIRFCRV